MKRTLTVAAAALAACVGVGVGELSAHHSGSMYEPTSLWVKGTVTRFERIDPHTLTTLEERAADGSVRRWVVEGPGRSQLARLELEGAVPTVGAVLEVCAFPYKSVEELSRLFPEADFSRRVTADADGTPRQTVAGHVLVTADGARRVWEPHGSIADCIRSKGESRDSWVELLNTDTGAWEAWCQQREFAIVRSSAPLTALVAEVNGALRRPCP